MSSSEVTLLDAVKRARSDAFLPSYGPLLEEIWKQWHKTNKINFWPLAEKFSFNEAGDDLLIIPFLDNLISLGFINAYTELLSSDGEVVEGSLKQGAFFRDDYSGLDGDYEVKIVISPGENYKSHFNKLYDSKKSGTEDSAKIVVPPKKLEEKPSAPSVLSPVAEDDDGEELIDLSEKAYDSDEQSSTSQVDQSEEIESGSEEEMQDSLEWEVEEKELDEVRSEDKDQDNQEEWEESNQLSIDEDSEEKDDDDLFKTDDLRFDDEEPSEEAASAQSTDDLQVKQASSHVDNIEVEENNERNLESSNKEEDSFKFEDPFVEIPVEDRATQQAKPTNLDTARKPKPDVVLGRTKKRFQNAAILASGYVLAGLITAYSVYQTKKAYEKVDSAQSVYNDKLSEMVVVKKKELEDLKQTLVDQKAQIKSLEGRQAEMVSAKEAELSAKFSEEKDELTKKYQEIGRQEGLGLSATIRDRIAVQSANHVVVSGECEAFGRGNRIDKIYPANLGMEVRYWLVEPESKAIAGVVASSSTLLERQEGAISHVRCIQGNSDIWPSYKSPVVGQNGQARPIDRAGSVIETNPLLRN